MHNCESKPVISRSSGYRIFQGGDRLYEENWAIAGRPKFVCVGP